MPTTARHYIIRSRAVGNSAAHLHGTGYAPTAQTRDGYDIIRGPKGHSHAQLFRLLRGLVPLSDLIGPLPYAEAVCADYGGSPTPRPAPLAAG